MAGELYLSGLVSGIDSTEWMNKIMKMNTARVAALQNRQKAMEAKKSAWSAIDGQLKKLDEKLATLRKEDTFFGRKAGTSAKTVVDTTVKAEAAVGSYAVEVLAVAKAHAVTSGPVADAGAALGVSGTVTIAGTAVTVATTDTLYTLRDRINNSVIAVSAQVLQVAAGGSSAYQLVLTAKESGSAKAITFAETAVAGTATLAQAGTAGIATAALTSTSSAAAGLHRIDVDQIAQYHKVAGTYVADPGAVSYTGTFKLNGVAVTVNGADMNQLATAITTAGAGVTAAVVTDGNGSRLELTSATMGSIGAISVDLDADGVLQSAGVVRADRTYRNALQAAQDALFTVGGQRYQRGDNANITDVIPGVTLTLAGAGETSVEVDVADGGVLRSLGFWDNAGAVANELTAAGDAEVLVNGRRYLRGSNAITDIVENLTLNLAGLGTATVTVAKDTEEAVKAVSAFVTEFNRLADVLDRYAGYDKEAKRAGLLFGDGLIGQLRRSMGAVTEQVTGLPVTLNSAGQVGVTTGAWDTADYGRLKLNADDFKTKLEADPAGVAKLFGAVRVNTAAASENATATATSNSANAADVINGDSTPERWGSAGGGWESAVPPTAVSPQYLTVQFTSTKTINEVAVYSLGGTDAYPTADHVLTDYRLQYWNGSDWTELKQVSANTAAVNYLEFAAVTTSQIRLEITGAAGGGNAKVLEVQAYQENQGIAARLHSMIQSATGAGGIATRNESLGKRIEDAKDRIETLEDRLVREEARLRRQFTELEKAMAKFQNQGNMVVGMIQSLGR